MTKPVIQLTQEGVLQTHEARLQDLEGQMSRLPSTPLMNQENVGIGSSYGTDQVGEGSFISKTSPMYDIRAWGADTANADNLTAIQAAIDDASDTGATIFIPQGVWKVGSPGIVIPSSITLKGVQGTGKSQTQGSILTQKSGYTTGPVITFSDGGFPQYIKFEDIQIWNQGTHGLYTTEQLVECSFRDCSFFNASASSTGNMFLFHLSGSDGAERNRWEMCSFFGGGIDNFCIYVDGGGFFDKNKFIGCHWRDFNSYAMVTKCTHIRTMGMYGCIVHGQDGVSNRARGTFFSTCQIRGLHVASHFTENIGDRGAGSTGIISNEGDFVFAGTSFLAATIDTAYLCDGGSNAAYIINVPNNPGKFGTKAVHCNMVGHAHGALNDPNSLVERGNTCDF